MDDSSVTGTTSQPLCGATQQYSTTDEERRVTAVLTRNCLLPLGHDGPHWSLHLRYGAFAWTGDDRP